MVFRTFQECRQADGWQIVRVLSGSDPDKRYTVHVNPWGAVDENICECLGYVHRGTCRHQLEAAKRLCTWREDSANEIQTIPQRKSMVCPRCGGPTKWQVEVDEQ